MKTLKKWYYNKYLSDFTEEELKLESERIDLAIHLLAFTAMLIILGGIL